jgi:two-component system OmpR family sensor kinase
VSLRVLGHEAPGRTAAGTDGPGHDGPGHDGPGEDGPGEDGPGHDGPDSEAAGPDARGPRTLVPRTLRTRLVAGMLLLVTAACAVVTVVTTVALREFLVGRLDDELLLAVATTVVAGPADADLLDATEPVGPLPSALTLVAVIDDGSVVGASVTDMLNNNERLPRSEYPVLLAQEVGAEPRSVRFGELGAFRVVARSAPSGEVVVFGLPEQDVRDTVTRLITIELAVVGIVLAGSGLAAAAVVRRELRPLGRVAATARRVTALPLDRGEVELVDRVPEADTDPQTEIGQVGAALNQMLVHVGDALAARQESENRLRRFVADASHELRTPLAAVRGYTELTRRDITLRPQVAHALSRISSQSDRMTTLVEDLLLLARLDSGRPLEHAAVDLTDLLVTAIGDAHVAGPEHRWLLDVPAEPVIVTGDAGRLAQVVANLLANARVHTPAGTVVRAGLRTTEHDTRLTVHDEGPGIAPELLPQVFERFARGSRSRSRSTGSTGLGLAIVDAVVRAHGGWVVAESRPGRTELTVVLPEHGRTDPTTSPTCHPAPEASTPSTPSTPGEAGTATRAGAGPGDT